MDGKRGWVSSDNRLPCALPRPKDSGLTEANEMSRWACTQDTKACGPSNLLVSRHRTSLTEHSQTVQLRLREQIRRAGLEIDGNRDVLLHDQPFPVELAVHVGDTHGYIQL